MNVIKPVVTNTAARLPALADIPIEKRERMVARTFIGILFVSLGAVMLVALVLLPVIVAWRAQDFTRLSMPLLITGLTVGFGAAILGATIWSGQVVTGPVRFVIASAGGLWDVFRRRNPPS